MSVKELKNFPRLIVDISDWGCDKKQVAQLCIIKDGKKSFVNVEIERTFYQDSPQAFCVITNVSKLRDIAEDVPIRIDMDLNGDEENAVETYKVKA